MGGARSTQTTASRKRTRRHTTLEDDEVEEGLSSTRPYRYEMRERRLDSEPQHNKHGNETSDCAKGWKCDMLSYYNKEELGSMS